MLSGAPRIKSGEAWADLWGQLHSSPLDTPSPANVVPDLQVKEQTLDVVALFRHLAIGRAVNVSQYAIITPILVLAKQPCNSAQ